MSKSFPRKYSLIFSSLLFTFIILVSLPVNKIAAFTISPERLELQPGETQTFSIFAAPSNPTNAVSVQISFTNLKVTALELATNLLSIGICEDGKRFTDNAICVDIAASDDFTPNQLLATFTVLMESQDGAQFQTEPGSMYADRTAVNTIVVSAISSPQTETTLTDSTSLIILIAAGLALVVSGMILVRLISKRNKAKDVIHQGAQSEVVESPVNNPF